MCVLAASSRFRRAYAIHLSHVLDGDDRGKPGQPLLHKRRHWTHSASIEGGPDACRNVNSLPVCA